MAGLVTARVTPPMPAALWLAASALTAAGAASALCRRRRTAGWGAAIVLTAYFAGGASYTLHRRRMADWESLPPREAVVSLHLERVFAPRDPKRSSGLALLVAGEGSARELVGQRVYFSSTLRAGEPTPRRSAVLAASGILAPLPSNPAADSFDGYLVSAGVNFRLTRARLLREERPPPAYHRFCATAAARFRTILGLGIEAKRPRLAALLRAMMLGETGELSDEQHTMFMQSGTMHLFAISGLNIAVIAGALHALLLLFRLPPWARFVIGTPLLWLFVDITGAAPSAVRAFAMAVFFHAAFVLRRPANPLAALVASAAVVLLLSPLQLFSASFLMSYGIVVSLLVLGLPLGEAWLQWWRPWRDMPAAAWNWWQRRIDGAWRATATAVAISLATTLVSILTSVQFFRLLTPGALVANLVLIPAAMVVTLGGFAALLCGLAGFAAGAILCNHAAALVLLVIESLVRASIHLPGAFVSAHFSSPWIGHTALAAVIAVLLFGYDAGWRRERGGWWPPFAIVALTLVLGVRFA